MHIKKGFVLRKMCGEYVVTADGLDLVNFNKLITLNDSAAYLWECLGEKEFDQEMLAGLLEKKYDITKEQALKDTISLCETWKKLGITEE